MNKHSLKAIGIVVFILVGCVVLWKVSGIIVRKGYSSQSVVSKEAEKSTESNKSEEVSTIETTTEENNVGFCQVDYTDRVVKAEIDDNKYYKNRIKEYKNNGEDTSRYVKLKSYYYGDYDKNYKSDMNTVLQNYSGLIEFLNSITEDELLSYDKEMQIPSYAIDKESPEIKCSSIQDVILGCQRNEGLLKVDNMTLVGVLFNRWFVFSPSENFSNYSELAVMDSSTLIGYSYEGMPLENNLYRMGWLYSLNINSNYSKIVNIKDRRVVLFRGDII